MKSQLFAINIFLLLTLFTTLAGQEKDTVQYTNLTPYYFNVAYKQDDSAILIDVREFFEYKKSRIQGAVNIASSDNLEISADTIDKSHPLFFYCSSGFRSKRVAKYFSDNGFSKVYNLDGGLSAWKEEAMPVEKKKLKR